MVRGALKRVQSARRMIGFNPGLVKHKNYFFDSLNPKYAGHVPSIRSSLGHTSDRNHGGKALLSYECSPCTKIVHG